jgi:hypothetical protein
MQASIIKEKSAAFPLRISNLAAGGGESSGLDLTRMISENELVKLMADLESDRVERTISTNDTTNFREAICAFSNDFPNHRQPGFLLIGVEDKTGRTSGLSATDELLRNLAGLRQDGEILPQPAMTVGRIALSDGSGDVVNQYGRRSCASGESVDEYYRQANE